MCYRNDELYGVGLNCVELSWWDCDWGSGFVIIVVWVCWWVFDYWIGLFVKFFFWMGFNIELWVKVESVLFCGEEVWGNCGYIFVFGSEEFDFW